MGEKKIKDERVTPVHYVIAREPKSWVLLPVSGDVKNWKRVENRLIRWFGGKLNVKGRIKKKGKRKRPMKEKRVKETVKERKEREKIRKKIKK